MFILRWFFDGTLLNFSLWLDLICNIGNGVLFCGSKSFLIFWLDILCLLKLWREFIRLFELVKFVFEIIVVEENGIICFIVKDFKIEGLVLFVLVGFEGEEE